MDWTPVRCVIQGYIVEYKKPGELWKKHNEEPIRGTDVTIKGLDDGEYEFRVRAKNSAGVSEPSNPISVDIRPKYSEYPWWNRVREEE